MPHRQGQPAATVARLSPTSARIVLDGEAEIVHLGTAGRHHAAVERNGKTTVLIATGAVAELDKADFGGIPTSVDQGAGRPGAKVRNNAAKVHSFWHEACVYCQKGSCVHVFRDGMPGPRTSYNPGSGEA